MARLAMARQDTPADTSTVKRIDDLEARLAQQDQSILELSDEMYRQQQQIAHLELELRHQAERLKAVAIPEPASEPQDETPPHY
jgi:SlyX protein